MESRPRVHQRGGPDEAAERQSLVREISALWAELLNDREVGADDDFFSLGGNSLIGIRILDRVSRDYGVELSARALYLARTPARVAELIAHERTGERTPP